MREEEFEEVNLEAVRHVIARLGVGHVRAFGLSWEDGEELLTHLGYRAKVEVCESN